MVLAVCRRLLPDTAEAEDAMQQTYVSAYRSLLAGSEPRRADVWLAAIARNECLDRIRTRMREPLAEHGRNGRSEAPDALAALIAGEELRALSRSIEQLPAQQREALVLHEFCGLPYGEVAAAIGVSESAIGSLLFRARRSVRSAFRRGYAVLPLPEIWNASATFGAAAGTGPLIVWLMERAGWRGSFLLTAPAGLLLAAVWWWYVRDRPSEHPGVSGEERALIDAGRTAADFAPPTRGAWRLVLRNRQVRLLALGYFCATITSTSSSTGCSCISSTGEDFQLLEGGWYAAMPWMAGAVGAVVGGWLCDRLWKRLGARRSCCSYLGAAG